MVAAARPGSIPEFGKLPAEVLGKIFEKVNCVEVKRLRLVCKDFANAGIRHLSSRCSFSCTTDGLKKLDYMAKHPLFSKCIDTLAFDSSLLVSLPNLDTFKSHVNVFRTIEPPTGTAKELSSAADLERSRQNEQFRVFQALLKEQEEIVGSGKDVKIIESSIRKFSRLKHVYIYVGRFRRGGPRLRNAFANTLKGIPYYELQKSASCTVHRFLFIMNALKAAGSKVEHLEFRSLSYSVLKVPSETLQTTQSLFSGLKKLDINLSDEPDPNYRGSPFNDIVSNGKLARLLLYIPQLTRLSLTTSNSRVYGDIVLDDVFGNNHFWPHLESLSLKGFCSTEHTLVNLILRHSSTLRDLTIASANMIGSWRSALPTIRDNTNLSQARVYRDISNDSNEYWSLGGNPDRWTGWDMNEAPRLGVLVGFYLCKIPEDFECPLHRENML